MIDSWCPLPLPRCRRCCHLPPLWKWWIDWMHWHLDWTTVHSGHLNRSWWMQPDDSSHCMICSIFSKVHEMGANCGCNCQRSQELWQSEKPSHWQVWPPDLCFPQVFVLVSDSCLQPHIHYHSKFRIIIKQCLKKQICFSNFLMNLGYCTQFAGWKHLGANNMYDIFRNLRWIHFLFSKNTF